MLYSERKRMRELEDREAAGDSLWTDEIPVVVRNKIASFIEFAMDAQNRRTGGWYAIVMPFLDRVDRTIRLGTGLDVRHVVGPVPWESGDLRALMSGFGFSQEGTDRTLNFLEAVYASLPHRDLVPPSTFENFVNDVLNKHRVAYKMINGEVVPFTSDELHTGIVEPALRLLHGRPDYVDTEVAYQKALKEISSNDPADAITDAGTALQELLKAMGCSGHSLGQLIPSAKSMGLLGSYDARLTDAIESIASWATKERNDNGDAHKNSPAVLADAWLMVHVVGALIVRLVDPANRGS